jgi:hypothetical protein
MSYFSRYDKGEWATICDVCGRKFRNQDLRQRWDGLKTCSDDWEPRQPQDFVRGVADYQAPVWTRPESSDKFVRVAIIYDDYGNPLMPIVGCSSTATINIGRPKNVLATVNAPTVTINTTTYPKPVVSKLVDGFAINTVTLG